MQPIVIVGAGQSGLATAHAVLTAGMRPLIIEAADRPAGSWPTYYDSLTLFSPARYSAMDGLPFPGDPDHYPHRDEVVGYLEKYAARLDVEIRTGTRVVRVDEEFTVHTSDGERIRASGVVAASGSRPVIPALPGQPTYTGELAHVVGYRNPEPYAGKRIVVVGGGHSAVQIGYELAKVASVTLATRSPLLFQPQRTRGQDIHHWAVTSGFDHFPVEWLARLLPGRLINDTGIYEEALKNGLFDRRPMFSALDGDRVVWPDGQAEPVDVVLLATGYQPRLDYLADLGALTPEGLPLHTGGLSLTHPGLGYVGLEFQRSFSSNTLRGVAHDATHVVTAVAAYARGALETLGIAPTTPQHDVRR
ncbi:flavin-containing monooxygenase [Spirillospora sp. CA-294931]|uniref:flavin-containing monooxygenase n=1 Tax=Spirillospora sp. CA-294931 TaxID=3240042 RepID=UPI003D904FFD